MQIFNPLSKQKSLRCKGLHESEACGYGCFITYPREVRLSSRDVFQQVSSGIADFGFLADEIDTGKLEHSVLFSENAVIVMPQNHPLTKKSVITLKDLSETDFIALNPEDRIQKTLTQAMRSQGLSLKTRIETPYSPTVCELARCGVGVGAANPTHRYPFALYKSAHFSPRKETLRACQKLHIFRETRTG